MKVSKYAHLDTSHHFVPLVVETSGVLGEATEEFTISQLARCIYKALDIICNLIIVVNEI